MKLTHMIGDLTDMEVDAVVNAANTGLRGGGGLDGAIHMAAGPKLYDELQRCYPEGGQTGQVYPTRGYRMPARFVLHAVGPDFRRSEQRDPSLLENCYLRALEIADYMGLETTAFPLISAGIYQWPLEEAIEIAIDCLDSYVPHYVLSEAFIVVMDDLIFAKIQEQIQ